MADYDVANRNYPSSGTIRYSPEVFSMKVMRIFTESTVHNEICNNDYEGDIKGKGDTVAIRVAPTYMNTNIYDVDEELVFETPSDLARQLPIDQAAYVAFALDDVDKVQSDLSLMEIFAERAANSLKIDIDKEVLLNISTGAMDTAAAATAGWATNSTGNEGLLAGKVSASWNLGGASAAGCVAIDGTNAVDYIADLGSVLDEADVGDEGRWVTLPAWYTNMLKKSDLKAADVTGDATGVIRTGLIGEIDRFKCYRTNLMNHVTDADGGAGSTSVEAFYVNAGVKDACTFASQLTKTKTTEDPKRFRELWASLMVYGRKVIMPEALATLYCYKG